MIETNTGTFRDLLLHVRDNAEAPFLFHCTGICPLTLFLLHHTLTPVRHEAGKDRTGAAAGLLLALAGAPRDYICRDFALTRIGTEPFRDFLTMKLTGGKPVDTSDEMVKWKMKTFGSSKYARNTDFQGCTAGLTWFRAEFTAAFLESIEEKYGDIENCVKQLFDLDNGDVASIRANLASP